MKDIIRTVLADSDYISRTILREKLESAEDFELLGAARDGDEVLALIKQRPQLLITDMFLPDLNGFALLAQLHTQRPKPRVMLLSNYYTDRLAAQVCAQGADLFFAKPFEPDNLINHCRRICSPEAYKDDMMALFEQRAIGVLREIGMPMHLKGYQYLLEAIAMSVLDASLVNAVTKVIYPKVARGFGSKASRVERAIRNAIEVTWQRGNQRALQKYFGCALPNNSKPTNGVFIFTIAEHLRAKYLPSEAEAI